jgi:hypothetical protein
VSATNAPDCDSPETAPDKPVLERIAYGPGSLHLALRDVIAEADRRGAKVRFYNVSPLARIELRLLPSWKEDEPNTLYLQIDGFDQ